MLTKDLLRVSRAGGGYQPRFADASDEALAAAVIDVYRDHVGETRADAEAALTAVERGAADFKLVRGFAKLLEREATFEVRSAIPPVRARRAAFVAASKGGVVTPDERAAALARAAADLGIDSETVETALYADRADREVLIAFDSRWTPSDLVARYNLSLAQTALFDATEVRVRCSDPRAIVAAIKRLGLLYEIRKTPEGREVVLTGPDALFRATRRYGTSFARLVRTVAGTADWRLEATIDDRGAERELVLTDADPVRVPDAEPLTEPSYDSQVEREFAASFGALDLDWTLVREPEPLDAGDRIMIPDFAFDYAHADFRVFLEIMGFWTPEYVEKKLAQLDAVDLELLVAVDESLGAGPEIEARDHRVIPYSGSVRVKDVRDVLREFETDLVAESAAALPAELDPAPDVISLADLAAERGVSEAALSAVSFPEHDLVGRTLVRPAVLDSVSERIEAGMALADAEAILDEHGLDDASAVLSRLGYRVEWTGLSGGTLRRRATD